MAGGRRRRLDTSPVLHGHAALVSQRPAPTDIGVGAAATDGGRTVELLVNGLVAVVVPLLGNESTVELRVLVDRPIVEL